MGFEDLEQKLKCFFAQKAPRPDQALKAQIRQKTLEVFYQKKSRPTYHWGFWRARLSMATSLVLIVSFLGFWISPLSSNTIAGQIEPVFGPVEIIRDGENILIEEPTDIRVGDSVKIGNKAQAIVTLPNQVVSVAKDRTELTITGKDAVFLAKGTLENEVLRGAEITTDRGAIKSPNGSQFRVSVSETGETKVSPDKNLVEVYDTNDGKVALNEGEEITLKSDTHLANIPEVPDDLQLSNAQIEAIQAKLIISRTKLVTGVDKILSGESRSAKKDLESAEKTFTSIAQVLLTSRELEIAQRQNLDALSYEDILPRVAAKTDNQSLLVEIKAVEGLFTIVSQNKGNFAFAPQSSGVESFDRYVTLKNLLSLGAPEEQEAGKVLLDKYTVNFLRSIQNEPLRIDQISLLNDKINLLPRNKTAREFLESASLLFPPDLQVILEEKIEAVF